MTYWDIAIIALIMISLTFQFFSLRFTLRMIQESTMKLDHSLAGALKATVENLPQTLAVDLEAPNPIQSLIAEAIKQRINPQVDANAILTRDVEGKFTDISS